MADVQWDPDTNTFIAAGSSYGHREVREWVDDLVEYASEELADVTSRAMTGEITAAEFDAEFSEIVFNLQISSAVMAAGGDEQLEGDALSSLEDKLDFQLERADAFANDVAEYQDAVVAIDDGADAGEFDVISEAEALARSDLYANGGIITYENSVRERELASDVYDEESRLCMNDPMSCDGCLEWAVESAGWFPIATELPDIGGQGINCGPNDRCSFQYRNSQTGEEDLADEEKSLLRKYSDEQPRDDHGRWTSGGGGYSQDANGAWKDSEGNAANASDSQRLKDMSIPPAWTNVKLNPDTKSDLQVVGKDSKGRSQYVYSAEHSERMSAEKFQRGDEFNKELPRLREQMASDLNNQSLSERDRESAAVLTLIDKTGFRIGSDNETGAAKQAYGASTLLAEHVKIDGDKVEFNFVGKKGVDITKTVEDRSLAQMLASRVAAGGRLFNTKDSNVRDYLHERDGQFKVKDFRTWHGTSTAIREIGNRRAPSTEREFKSSQKEVAKVVATHLGNTPSVALSSYINPAVWGPWRSGWK